LAIRSVIPGRELKLPGMTTNQIQQQVHNTEPRANVSTSRQAVLAAIHPIICNIAFSVAALHFRPSPPLN
jgi:hypothetical protein